MPRDVEVVELTGTEAAAVYRAREEAGRLQNLPSNRSVAAEAGVAVAAALLAAKSEWKPGKPEDLGQTATLTMRKGSLRQPGDPPSVTDAVQTVVLHFRSETT